MKRALIQHVIQFMHPGTEYPLRGNDGNMGWNYDSHHRKFMYAKGDYTDGKKRFSCKPLYFWGEWEPQSHYSRTKFASPRYQHKPYLDLSVNKVTDDGRVRQNTDPFVFSDAFYYRCCQQVRTTGPTQLSFLDAGSIILFGSNVNGGFALDTVFVVADSREYTDKLGTDELQGFVPDIYPEIVSIGFGEIYDDISHISKPATGCGGSSCSSKQGTLHHKPVSFRCYKGATFEERVDGMYSFVPCRLKKDAEYGFGRPVIKSSDIDFISDNQHQGFNIMRDMDAEKAKEVWQIVRQVCKRQGCLEGLRFYYD